MSIGIFFWVVYLVWLLVGGMGISRVQEGRWGVAGISLAMALLLFLIGWKLFGFPIRG
jgi:hypothetical protein